MSETKHTAGPWTVGELIANDGGIAVLSDDGRVCLVDAVSPVKRGQGWTHQDADRDANARLIAAAPDLASAGKHLAVKLAEAYRAAGIKMTECQALRDWVKVITKAEGR
jgi:hypothetical protein